MAGSEYLIDVDASRGAMVIVIGGVIDDLAAHRLGAATYVPIWDDLESARAILAVASG